MPPITTPYPQSTRFSGGSTRTRILRDATVLFLRRGPHDTEAARQYTELAAGLLSRIDRNEAFAIARKLITMPNLPATVLRPFADLGINVNRPTDTLSIDTQNSGVATMADDWVVDISENEPLANGSTDQAKKHANVSTLSNHNHGSEIHSAGISGVDHLAMMRACERRDKCEFVDLASKILCNHHLYVSPEQLTFSLKDGCGETLVMLTVAVGGDHTLLAKALDSFIDAGDNKLKSIQKAMQFYETIDQVAALCVLSDFFIAPQIAKTLPVQHVTVQSGQSVNLSLRNSAQSSKNLASNRLSERLFRSLR